MPLFLGVVGCGDAVHNEVDEAPHELAAVIVCGKEVLGVRVIHAATHHGTGNADGVELAHAASANLGL
jgi:hypothetical protein